MLGFQNFIKTSQSSTEQDEAFFRDSLERDASQALEIETCPI